MEKVKILLTPPRCKIIIQIKKEKKNVSSVSVEQHSEKFVPCHFSVVL